MAVLPSNLPEGASLPLIVGGALVVAWVISRFSRRPAAMPQPAPSRARAAGRTYDAEILRCRDDLAGQFSARLGFAIRTTSYGAVDIDPAYLVIWFITDSDAQRDRLLAVPDFDQTCRVELAASGYPAKAVPHVHFSAASEETVQRDWGGNWWHFFK